MQKVVKFLTRTSYAMGKGPVLPEDPTKPVNPFGPKPTGPVLPDIKYDGFYKISI